MLSSSMALLAKLEHPIGGNACALARDVNMLGEFKGKLDFPSASKA